MRIIHYYSKLFTGVLSCLQASGRARTGQRAVERGERRGPRVRPCGVRLRLARLAGDRRAGLAFQALSWANSKFPEFYFEFRILDSIPGGSAHGERANFTGLVIGCIDTYDSESTRIFFLSCDEFEY